MPSFYPRTSHRQSPVGLYDQNSSQSYGNAQTMTQVSYIPSSVMATHNEKAAYDYADPYGHQMAFAAPGALSYQTRAMQGSYSAISSNVSHLTQSFGPISAPVLPPLRSHDRPAMENTSTRHVQFPQRTTSRTEQAKEEKAVGGVAAHLDYEMDQMADFVSEMAQGIVQPSSPVSPAFRKFVSQILSSTRLPSSTILLGLSYLAARMNMLSLNGQYKASSGQVYRMLTIALLLGSKFLDDNTFQNRSWSEVTGLLVSELNTLEVEWLVAIDWNLHTDPLEPQGLLTWRGHWEAWKDKSASRSHSMKLTPIDTNIQRPRHQTRGPSPSAYPPQYTKSASVVPNHSDRQQLQYQSPAHYDQNGWQYSQSIHDRSPPSAPETGPPTPEYYGTQTPWSLHGHPPPPYSIRQHSHASSQPPSYHHTPYNGQYTHAQSNWNGHGVGCSCMYCVRSNEPYLSAGYGVQTVVG